MLKRCWDYIWSFFGYFDNRKRPLNGNLVSPRKRLKMSQDDDEVQFICEKKASRIVANTEPTIEPVSTQSVAPHQQPGITWLSSSPDNRSRHISHPNGVFRRSVSSERAFCDNSFSFDSRTNFSQSSPRSFQPKVQSNSNSLNFMNFSDTHRTSEKARYRNLFELYTNNQRPTSNSFNDLSIRSPCNSSSSRLLSPATTSSIARFSATISPQPRPRTTVAVCSSTPHTVPSASHCGTRLARANSTVTPSSPDIIVDKVIFSSGQKKTSDTTFSDKLREQLARIYAQYKESEVRHLQADTELRRQLHLQTLRLEQTRLSGAEWERGVSQRLRDRLTQLRCRAVIDARTELQLLDQEWRQEAVEEEAVGRLPEITAEMQRVIAAALQPHPSDEVLSEAFNQRITRHDIQTLNGLNWLNDEIVNFYFSLLMQRSASSSQLPSVHAFNTFFYPKLMKQGYTSIRRWTRKVDIFSKDLLLMPVHLGMHWCLLCVDFGARSVTYYDSMGTRNEEALSAVLGYLQQEHVNKRGAPYPVDAWTILNQKKIPRQMNGSDCGVFACQFADYLCRQRPLSFTQEQMPYFRHRMVYEILKQKLLQ